MIRHRYPETAAQAYFLFSYKEWLSALRLLHGVL